jgi:hypothetical protein
LFQVIIHEGKEFESKSKYAKIKRCMEIKYEIDTDLPVGEGSWF